jgi:hypothetical protein
MPGVDALMVVVPADKPLTESCAELGMEVLEAWNVTAWLAAGGLPSFVTFPLPEVRVTISELASGVDVVTLIVPLPPACSVTPPAGDRMIVGGGGVMVNEAVSETCNHVDWAHGRDAHASYGTVFRWALDLDLRASAAQKDKREGQYDCGEHKGEKTLAREAHGENLLFLTATW